MDPRDLNKKNKEILKIKDPEHYLPITANAYVELIWNILDQNTPEDFKYNTPIALTVENSKIGNYYTEKDGLASSTVTIYNPNQLQVMLRFKSLPPFTEPKDKTINSCLKDYGISVKHFYNIEGEKGCYIGFIPTTIINYDRTKILKEEYKDSKKKKKIKNPKK